MIKQGIDQHEERQSKFAIMYLKAIETGSFKLPPCSKNQAISIRSQLNRYRKEKRASAGTHDWDLVSNRLVQITDNTWAIHMTYEKSFWDAVNEGLGIDPIAVLREQSAQPKETPNITDLLSDTFGVQ
jgi:hypothetical protein